MGSELGFDGRTAVIYVFAQVANCAKRLRAAKKLQSGQNCDRKPANPRRTLRGGGRLTCAGKLVESREEVAGRATL